MHRDFVFGCATLALAAAYYALAAGIPESALADAIGPAGLPKAYGVLLAGLSLVLIGGALIRRRAARPGPAPGREPESGRRPAAWRVAALLAAGIVYLLVVPWLGYVTSLAGLIMAAAWLQGGSPDRRTAALAVSGAALFWLLFVVLLQVPHPSGVWGALF